MCSKIKQIRRIKVIIPTILYETLSKQYMTRILLILSILLLVLACDVSKEDYLSPTISEENQTNNFYTLSSSGLTINPTAFQTLKEAKSLEISQLPQNGEARFIENGFVFYKVLNSSATTDDLKIKGKTSAGNTVEEQIKINIVKNSTDLPCFAGLIGENLSIEADKSTEIDVLTNDKTCGNLGTVSIEIQPKNGKVEVSNQKIIYTPNKGFYGTDVFFYRASINNTKNPVAPVELKISEPEICKKGITDDFVFLQNYNSGTEILLDVLENDRICKEYEKAELRINKNPTKGSIRIEKTSISRSVIYYKATQKSIEDTFEYALYRTDKDFIKATVMIKID